MKNYARKHSIVQLFEAVDFGLPILKTMNATKTFLTHSNFHVLFTSFVTQWRNRDRRL